MNNENFNNALAVLGGEKPLVIGLEPLDLLKICAAIFVAMLLAQLLVYAITKA